MSIRTNRMKAVASLQRRLTSVKSREESNISDKLDKLMADLTAIKDLFSTVKSNEDELLDTLKLVDDLLRNFKTDKFFDISKRILETDKPTNADPQKGELMLNSFILCLIFFIITNMMLVWNEIMVSDIHICI